MIEKRGASLIMLLAFTVSIDYAHLLLFGKDVAHAEEDRTAKNFSVKKSKRDIIESEKLSYAPARYESAVKEGEEALMIEPQEFRGKEYIVEKKDGGEKTHKGDVALIEMGKIPKEGNLVTLSLDDCITIAVKNHMPLQIAEKNIKLGEMRVRESRRNLLPSLTVRWEESEGRVTARRYVGKKQSLEGQQPVFHGGELYFTMKQAETNLKIVKEEYKRIKNDLVLQVKKAYYTLGKAKDNLRMQAELKGEVEAIFDMVKRAFEAGAISKLELLNVSSQASQVGFQFASAEGDVSVADLILKQTMYMDPKEIVNVNPALEFKKIEIDSDMVLRAAFMNRQEMTINSLMVEYYNYERNIAKAKGWLKIDVMGSWGLAKEEFVSEDLGEDPDRKLEQQWYAGIKASMPFWGSTAEYSYTQEKWVPVVSTLHGTEAKTRAVKINLLDNLKYYSDKQSAEIDFSRARQELAKAKQDIVLEVREGCFSYEKALRLLETASNKMKYQENDLEIVKFKRGMEEAQDSNVIESMIRMTQERFGYIQALVDCHISLAAINKAIGVSDYFKIDEDHSKK